MRRVLLGALAALALDGDAGGRARPYRRRRLVQRRSGADARGRYTDTLRGGEQLFYAVELKPGAAAHRGRHGQGPHGVELLHDAADLQPAARGGLLRRRADRVLRPDGRERLAARGGRPRRRGRPRNTRTTVCLEPGTYYVSLNAREAGSNLEAEQFDTSIDLQVTGEIIPAATPTATAEAAETAEPEEETAGLGSGGDDDGGGGELGMAIVLGLALGGVAGFGVRRLRSG